MDEVLYSFWNEMRARGMTMFAVAAAGVVGVLSLPALSDLSFAEEGVKEIEHIELAFETRSSFWSSYT